MKAEEWVLKEYGVENVDKWIFTRVDMEQAFKAGYKEAEEDFTFTIVDDDATVKYLEQRKKKIIL